MGCHIGSLEAVLVLEVDQHASGMLPSCYGQHRYLYGVGMQVAIPHHFGVLGDWRVFELLRYSFADFVAAYDHRTYRIRQAWHLGLESFSLSALSSLSALFSFLSTASKYSA